MSIKLKSILDTLTVSVLIESIVIWITSSKMQTTRNYATFGFLTKWK